MVGFFGWRCTEVDDLLAAGRHAFCRLALGFDEVIEGAGQFTRRLLQNESLVLRHQAGQHTRDLHKRRTALWFKLKHRKKFGNELSFDYLLSSRVIKIGLTLHKIAQWHLLIQRFKDNLWRDERRYQQLEMKKCRLFSLLTLKVLKCKETVLQQAELFITYSAARKGEF